MRKYSLDETVFETVDTEEKAYWLGFLLADGSIQIRKSGQAVIKLSLAIIDYKHLEKWKIFLNTEMPIKKYLVSNGKNDNKSESCEITITSKKIVNDLAKLGIGSNKSHTVKFPEIREDLVRHMIRGIWDGDGSVLYRKSKSTHTNHRPEIQLCGNYNICSHVKHYLVNKFNISDVKLHAVSTIFLFRYVGQSAKEVLDFLYSNCNIYLNRKYEKYTIIKPWKPIIKYPKNTKKSTKEVCYVVQFRHSQSPY
jgi:hypothetical protein